MLTIADRTYKKYENKLAYLRELVFDGRANTRDPRDILQLVKTHRLTLEKIAFNHVTKIKSLPCIPNLKMFYANHSIVNIDWFSSPLVSRIVLKGHTNISTDGIITLNMLKVLHIEITDMSKKIDIRVLDLKKIEYILVNIKFKGGIRNVLGSRNAQCMKVKTGANMSLITEHTPLYFYDGISHFEKESSSTHRAMLVEYYYGLNPEGWTSRNPNKRVEMFGR